MYNPYLKHKHKSFEERLIEKFHPLERDAIRENIEKFNFEIEFIETAYVLKQYCGGFSGRCNTPEVTEIYKGIPFGVLSVTKNKKTQCSKIHIWSDGLCDGHSCYLINVPNGLFREIHNDKVKEKI